MKFFITGSTGILGKRIVNILLEAGHDVHLLVRPESYSVATNLFSSPKLKIWNGDLTNPDIILNNEHISKLTSEIDVIIHMAALYDLRADRSSAYLSNVVGTQGLLYFANQCTNLKSFVYVSTIAVAGDYQGEFKESQLECGQNFENNYALTKYEAELLFSSWKLNAKKIILRPGIVIGDSKEGKVERIDGPYYFLQALAKIKDKKFLLETLKYLPMPFKRGAQIPLVPVDSVAKAIAKIALDPPDKMFARYHLLSSANATVQELLQDSFRTFDFKVEVIPLPDTKVNDLLMEKIGLPKELLGYLYSEATFSNSELIKDYPEIMIPSYYQFKNNFLSGAVNHFLKKRITAKKNIFKTDKVRKVAKAAAQLLGREMQ